MKVLVPVKRVVDYHLKVRVKSDESGVETANLKMSMNPFDEIAVEQAVQLKEQGLVDEIIVATVGESVAQDILRQGLALGADRAILVETAESFEPLNIAKILKALVEKESPELVIMGKQNIDGDNAQTGQMLAGLLGWSQGTFASQVALSPPTVTVTREIDGGLETLTLQLPAVITTDLRLNTPRYASLPNIMKAKQKPLESIVLSDLNLSLKKRSSVSNVSPPKAKAAGIKVDSVDALIAKLKDEAKVL